MDTVSVLQAILFMKYICSYNFLYFYTLWRGEGGQSIRFLFMFSWKLEDSQHKNAVLLTSQSEFLLTCLEKIYFVEINNKISQLYIINYNMIFLVDERCLFLRPKHIIAMILYLQLLSLVCGVLQVFFYIHFKMIISPKLNYLNLIAIRKCLARQKKYCIFSNKHPPLNNALPPPSNKCIHVTYA